MRKTISVFLAAVLLLGLLPTSAKAATDAAHSQTGSYSDAFQCLAEYAKQGQYYCGDGSESYSTELKLDDYRNNMIFVEYQFRADHGTFLGNLFPALGESVPMISVCFYQKNKDHSECRTSVCFSLQKPDECVVYLEVDPGIQLPWGQEEQKYGLQASNRPMA